MLQFFTIKPYITRMIITVSRNFLMFSNHQKESLLWMKNLNKKLSSSNLISFLPVLLRMTKDSLFTIQHNSLVIDLKVQRKWQIPYFLTKYSDYLSVTQMRKINLKHLKFFVILSNLQLIGKSQLKKLISNKSMRIYKSVKLMKKHLKNSVG